jgi:hypothetical protein
MSEIIDKVKEKAKDVKDKVSDTTKDVVDKTKDTMSPSTSTDSKSYSNQERKYEEGGSGTEIGRKDNPLTEYRENEAMTPAKIKEHEPTAVKRDPSDQKITEQGQTGTDTEAAGEQYRKRGMTKANSNPSDTL